MLLGGGEMAVLQALRPAQEAGGLAEAALEKDEAG